MATSIPAKAVKLQSQFGRLEKGYPSKLVILNINDFSV
jgi:N-acetylglucosamine-6-phosphate deacetylase